MVKGRPIQHMERTSHESDCQAAEANRERMRQKVLVVEDEADIRELLRYNLAQEGFAVEEAARRRRGARSYRAAVLPTCWCSI